MYMSRVANQYTSLRISSEMRDVIDAQNRDDESYNDTLRRLLMER